MKKNLTLALVSLRSKGRPKKIETRWKIPRPKKRQVQNQDYEEGDLYSNAVTHTERVSWQASSIHLRFEKI